MKTTKIAWMADTHVGFRQYGLERRETDFADAFEDATIKAVNAGAELIIHSGDIIHNNRPSAATIRCLKRMHDFLKKSGVPMYAISGNHDFSEPHWISVINPDNERQGICLIDNETVEYEGLKIHGIGWTPKEVLQSRLQELPKADIIVWHGAIQEAIKFPAASAFKLDELPLHKCQLWAAGDIHVNWIKEVNGTIVGYPGSTELNSASEDPVKVIKILTFEEGKLNKSIEDVRITTRPVVRLDIRDEEGIKHYTNSLKVDGEGMPKKPIVYVSAYQELGDVPSRFRQALDPDTYVLRFALTSSETASVIDEIAETGTVLSPIDFLPQILPPDSAYFKTVSRLLEPENDADQILEDFISESLD